MKKHYMVFIICMMSIVGCSPSYQDEDIAAVVRGEELTIGELRFLYPDDKIIDNLDGTIKAMLAIQEVKQMDIDLSEELGELKDNEEYLMINFLNVDEENPMAAHLKDFIEPQAKKLGMEVEDYYQKYYDKTQKISIYVVAYINEKLGEPDISDESYTERANQLLDDLVEEHRDQIEILIDK